MNKRAIYINVTLFIISIILLGLMIYWQITGGFLMASETLAISLLSLSFIFKKYNLIIGQWISFVLLVILLVVIINFSYTVQNGDTTTTYHTIKFTSPSINLIVFLVLLAFAIVNWRIFGWLFYGSKEEKQEFFNKKVSFYYHKFKDEPQTELENIFLLYKEYPKEAQVALTKIKKNADKIYKSGKRGSNSRPSVWETDALPAELFPLVASNI